MQAKELARVSVLGNLASLYKDFAPDSFIARESLERQGIDPEKRFEELIRNLEKSLKSSGATQV